MSKHQRIATLVKTLLIEAISLPDGKTLEFRVEIFSWSDHEYVGHVWWLDMYRIKPSFDKGPADEEFFVRDRGSDWDDLRAATVDELIDAIFEKIEGKFDVKEDRPALALVGRRSPPAPRWRECRNH